MPVGHRVPFRKAARAVGAEHILVAKGDVDADRAEAIVVDGRNQLKHGRATAGRVIRIRSGRDQERAAAADGVVVVEGDDWTIIPLENLIAARRDRPGTLFALARTPDDVSLFRDVLEVGVHGVVLAPQDPTAIEDADAALRARPGGTEGHGRRSLPPAEAPAEAAAASDITLATATITAIEDAGMGDRVCIDSTSLFEAGEGLLIGSTARAFALVHAETIETEYVRARPFRVNAGAVHSYMLAPRGKTRYLSESVSGDLVLAVGADGQGRELTIGRCKIERRPHVIVRFASAERQGSVVLQNAETVRLVRPGGRPLAVTDAAVGDDVLVHFESDARHFGMPVDEALEER